VTRRILLAAAASLLFLVVATANAGGYRYGISDQAFYMPAIAKSLDPALFPRDSPVLDAQKRLWLGDDIAALVAHGRPVDLEAAAAVLYVAGLLLLAGAVAYFLRGLGASWLAVSAGLVVATLRHHIAKTGGNTLEGYFHPRMIAYAVGIFALGLALRKRYLAAFAVVGAAMCVHTTAGLWFGSVVIAAVAWNAGRRWIWVVAAAIAIVSIGLAGWGPRMDGTWLAAVAEKDYLFPSAWPLHAWLLNLAYPIVLVLLYRRRLALGRTVRGEQALVVGLLVLVAGFLVSVPLSAATIALAVQLQITRVFWVIDAVVMLYLSAWLLDDVTVRAGVRWRAVALSVLCAFALARGYYVLRVEASRPLVAWRLPADDWNDTMTWLKRQPGQLNVLADPGHAWLYGSSVRLAASRDTVLEQIKDTALAMYDRDVAARVHERVEALSGFAGFSTPQLRDVGARFQADVVVVERTRLLDLPALYENARFRVYDLRR
jgi:hypothetical protein